MYRVLFNLIIPKGARLPKNFCSRFRRFFCRTRLPRGSEREEGAILGPGKASKKSQRKLHPMLIFFAFLHRYLVPCIVTWITRNARAFLSFLPFPTLVSLALAIEKESLSAVWQRIHFSLLTEISRRHKNKDFKSSRRYVVRSE